MLNISGGGGIMSIYKIAMFLISNPRRTIYRFTAVNLLLGLMVIILLSTSVFAAEQGQQTQGAEVGLKYLGAGLSVAGSTIGAGIALQGATSAGLAASTIGAGIALQGATSAGLAALVERPELAAWVLINAGLGEGVAIYGLIISILILGAI